jgi:hypothetical protein
MLSPNTLRSNKKRTSLRIKSNDATTWQLTNFSLLAGTTSIGIPPSTVIPNALVSNRTRPWHALRGLLKSFADCPMSQAARSAFSGNIYIDNSARCGWDYPAGLTNRIKTLISDGRRQRVRDQAQAALTKLPAAFSAAFCARLRVLSSCFYDQLFG